MVKLLPCLLLFAFFIVSSQARSIISTQPHQLRSFQIKTNQKSARSCSYTVTIKTSCSSTSYTRDKVNLAFGDAYGNEVYALRLDDPDSRTFEKCSTDTFQIKEPCTYEICYLYLLRTGSDGWKPESVKIYSPNIRAVTFYYNKFLPTGVWYGFKHCDRVFISAVMGSRSFPAGLAIEAIERGGEMPHLVDFYETAHWSKRKGDWIEPICREKHDEMKRRQEESSQPGATPLTQEQIAIAVLGKRSRYLKGLGVGLKSPSSSRSTVARDQEEVQSLKAEIESLRGLTQSQQARIEEQYMRVEEQDKRLEDQNKSFENQNKKLKELENIMWQQMEMTKALTSHGGNFSR